MYNYIIYKGVDSRTFGLYFEQETLSILPEQQQYTAKITGRDGVADFGIGGYDMRIIRVTAVFPGKLSELRRRQDEIAAWLYSPKGEYDKLILGAYPDRYYRAKITSELNFEMDSKHRVGEVEFICNPPWAFSDNGTLLSPEQLLWTNAEVTDNQFVKELTASGEAVRFVNAGTAPVQPVIRLYGYIRSGITLVCGDQSFTLNTGLRYDGVEINCASLTVHRISDHADLFEWVDSENDNFFTVPPGNAEIAVYQPSIGEWEESVTVVVEFEPMIGGSL